MKTFFTKSRTLETIKNSISILEKLYIYTLLNSEKYSNGKNLDSGKHKKFLPLTN